MNIPNQVKIGPYMYAVRFQTNLCTEDGEDLWGQCDYARQEILINKSAGVSDARLATTFLHEAIHAIAEARSCEICEEAHTAMAVGLYEFLKDNGLLSGEE